MIYATVTPGAFTERATKPGNIWRTEYSASVLKNLMEARVVSLSDGVREIVREITVIDDVPQVWQYFEAGPDGQVVSGINILLGKKVRNGR